MVERNQKARGTGSLIYTYGLTIRTEDGEGTRRTSRALYELYCWYGLIAEVSRRLGMFKSISAPERLILVRTAPSVENLTGDINPACCLG